MPEIDGRALVTRALTIGGYVRAGEVALRPSTRKEYGRMYGAFRDWCGSVALRAMPATPETLAEYALYLSTQQGYTRGTVESAVTAVRYFHAVQGEPVPSGLPAWYVLRGVDSTPRGVGVKARSARRVVIDALLAECHGGGPAGVRDTALVLLTYQALLTPPQLVALDWARVTDDGVVFRVGERTLALAHDAHTDDGCAPCAVLAWQDVLTAAGAAGGPLFRHVDKGGNIGGLRPTAGVLSPDGRMNHRSVHKVLDRLRRSAAGIPATERATSRAIRLAGLGQAARRGAGRRELEELGGYLSGSLRLLELLAHSATDDPDVTERTT